METKDYLRVIHEEIHSTVVATVDAEGHPVTRVIDMMLHDDNRLYFLTAKGKVFYEQLMEQIRLASQAKHADHLAHSSSAGLERQRVETEQVVTAINEMAATTLEVANNVARTTPIPGYPTDFHPGLLIDWAHPLESLNAFPHLICWGNFCYHEQIQKQKQQYTTD